MPKVLSQYLKFKTLNKNDLLSDLLFPLLLPYTSLAQKGPQVFKVAKIIPIKGDEIKEAEISVIIHPTMVRRYGALKMTALKQQADSTGLVFLFACQSSYEGYVPKTGIILFEAANAATNGLPREAALQAVTLNAAKILGLDYNV